MQLVVAKLGPLWQARGAVSVVGGLGFEVGEFRVRVGEVRVGGAGAGAGGGGAVGGGGGGGAGGRGAVCEVEWVGVEDGEEVDWDEAGRVIRGFWEALGVKGARTVIAVPGLKEGEGGVRQWCEILRIRG